MANNEIVTNISYFETFHVTDLAGRPVQTDPRSLRIVGHNTYAEAHSSAIASLVHAFKIEKSTVREDQWGKSFCTAEECEEPVAKGAITDWDALKGSGQISIARDINRPLYGSPVN